MGTDPFGNDDEHDAAEDRIQRIRHGNEAPQERAQPDGDDFQAFDDEPDVVSRARARARSTRDVLIGGEPADDEPPPSRARLAGGPTVPVAPPARRGRQAFMIIGGLVTLGIVTVVVLVLLNSLMGGSNPLAVLSPPTATMTPTATPTVTPTPTPAPTATAQAPNLALPPLTCIFQSGVGCSDYCGDPANAGECESASSFVAAQNADPDVFLECLAPGPGPNVGNPQDCLEEAWRANQ